MMIERRLICLSPSGFHEIVYSEWPGPAGAPTLLCVHGLTRNAKDFDTIAGALSADYRVVCPDMPGRGRSEYLVKSAEYVYPTYFADCAALIARLDVEHVDWLGTSMGALIGMTLAAQRGSPIRKLVINDIGPFVAKEGLERIASYVGLEGTFPTFEAFAAAISAIMAPFGPMTADQKRKLIEDSARQTPEGLWMRDYDPRIGEPFRAAPIGDVDLWPVWDAIRQPTLLIHGALSDLLGAETASEMSRRGPKAKVVEIADTGHAPPLVNAEQIGAVRAFLVG